jgi:WD40 repeat protein
MRVQGRINALTLSANGKLAMTIVSSQLRGFASEVQLWDSLTGKPIGQPIPVPVRCKSNWVTALSPDGQIALIGDHPVRILPLEEEGAEQITLRIQLITGKSLDDNDVVSELDASTWDQQRRQLEELVRRHGAVVDRR